MSIANPNFSETALSVAYLQKVGRVEFTFQSIDEFASCRCVRVLVICKFRNLSELVSLNLAQNQYKYMSQKVTFYTGWGGGGDIVY
jgi:hypothetical protein